MLFNQDIVMKRKLYQSYLFKEIFWWIF